MPRCRLCSAELRHTFVDLGMSPPCESYLTADQTRRGETFYPLHVRVCEECLLVQLPRYISAEDIFSDYAYFSSYSDSWVAHARRFVDDAAERLGLGPDSFVVEVASNDGYLLQHSRRARHPRRWASSRRPTSRRWPRAKGVPTEVMFLGERDRGRDRGRTYGQADLVVANNVFAHVPDIVDFSKGLRALVTDRAGQHRVPAPAPADRGQRVRHDLPRALLVPVAADRAAGARGRRAHRGRRRGAAHARRFAADLVHAGRSAPAIAPSVAQVLADEAAAGLHTVRATTGSPAQVAAVRNDFVEFLIGARARASGRRLRRSRARATPCSTTAASGPTCCRSPSTATRTSTGSSCPAPTSRSTPSTGWRPSGPTLS